MSATVRTRHASRVLGVAVAIAERAARPRSWSAITAASLAADARRRTGTRTASPGGRSSRSRSSSPGSSSPSSRCSRCWRRAARAPSRRSSRWSSNPDGTPNNAAYFWLTGGLSSFLDNAPTYLVFFELAGGDPERADDRRRARRSRRSRPAPCSWARTPTSATPRTSWSTPSRAGRGVRMPSFFGYMLWSGAVLIPVFLLTTLVFFR